MTSAVVCLSLSSCPVFVYYNGEMLVVTAGLVLDICSTTAAINSAEPDKADEFLMSFL